MEGGSPSPRAQEILQWWIDGVITSGEAHDLMMEHVTSRIRRRACDGTSNCTTL